VTEYQTVIHAAEEEADNGLYKEAYNTLGRALNIGGDADRECKYRRGVYALRVGHSRLDTFEKGEGSGQTLIKAGCWLSRSEAYLLSAREGASDEELRRIGEDLEEAKAAQERFRKLCRASKLAIFHDDDGTGEEE
jgi:hypothetical protein